ncbi:hypothetical protein [Novosphingobium sp.]|uniref:hypothetical protein n=1 Tax=Novosphingobium sp. TaxID=1874826 RepID=UPI0028ACFE7D|nr:hypothetical protein [Novosphingobium sp.]
MGLPQISTDVTATSCALATTSCDLQVIKSLATTAEGEGELDPSLADRIAQLECTVSTLAGQLSSINKRVIGLLYPPEGA